MISIKKYLEPNAESLETLLQVQRVLLQGMAQHVVDYDPEYCLRFRRGIKDISESFDESQSNSELLVLAGAAVKSLDDYNQHTCAHFRQQKAELTAMIKMLTETVTSISSASGDNVAGLQQIERLVGSAREVSDVKVIKMRLGDCLEGIRNEATRQRTEAEKVTQTLRSEIERSRLRAATAGSPHLDVLTALPPREAAESAMAARCASEKPSYIAVLMVDRLQLYNARFGRVAGDDILRHFAENIRKLLPQQDALFRWNGPTLLAILDRSCPVEDIRLELKRLLDKIPNISIQTETRSALLTITSRWGVFPTIPAVQLLIRKIDMFTSVHSGAAQTQA